MFPATNTWVLVSGLKKRVVLTVAGITVAAVLGFTALAGLGVGVAHAGNGALVINDFGCLLLDGDGEIVFTSSSHALNTQNENRNRVLKCSIKSVANSTGKAAHFDFKSTGYLCNAMGILTSNWHNKVSKSGNATLTCLVP